LELRRATAEASVQFGRILVGCAGERDELSVVRGGPIVEALPNVFLGVLMPEEELVSGPKLKRGRRFDWLYDQVVTTGRLGSMLSKGLQLPDEVWHLLGSERDHELRAALICLLAAALATRGNAAIIGDLTGGWFWLPPWSVWQSWAKQGFNSVVRKMASKGHVMTILQAISTPRPLLALPGVFFGTLESLARKVFSSETVQSQNRSRFSDCLLCYQSVTRNTYYASFSAELNDKVCPNLIMISTQVQPGLNLSQKRG
jgi:hypothetical protein